MIKLAGQNEFHKYRLPVKEFIVNVVLSFGFFGGSKSKIIESKKTNEKSKIISQHVFFLIMPIFAPSDQHV